jgi:hypothetical protein
MCPTRLAHAHVDVLHPLALDGHLDAADVYYPNRALCSHLPPLQFRSVKIPYKPNFTSHIALW